MKTYMRDVNAMFVRVGLQILSPAFGGVLVGLVIGWQYAISSGVFFGLLFIALSLWIARRDRNREVAKLWRDLMRLSRRHEEGDCLVATIDDDRVVLLCHRKRIRGFLRVRLTDVTRPHSDQPGVVPYDLFILGDLYSVFRIANAWPVEVGDRGFLVATDDAFLSRALTQQEIRGAVEMAMLVGVDRPTEQQLRELVDQVRHATPMVN